MNNEQKSACSHICFKHAQMNPRRVMKACDRCKLKKTKCDGKRPCSRCEAEDTVCSFATPRKSRSVIHPEGSVEMLLQQQEWLVSGLLELYRRTQLISDPSNESPTEGRRRAPSVHRILERLGVLDENQRCITADPTIVPSPRQHSGDGSSDTYEKAPYFLDVDPWDDQFRTYDAVQSGSFCRIPTTAAIDHTFATTTDDPNAALWEFQKATQRSDSTRSEQSLGTGFLSSHELLMSAFGEPVGEAMATKVQTTLEIPVPPAGYSDISSTIRARDTCHQQPSRPLLVQTTQTSGHRNSAHQNFKACVLPTMHSRG